VSHQNVGLLLAMSYTNSHKMKSIKLVRTITNNHERNVWLLKSQSLRLTVMEV